MNPKTSMSACALLSLCSGALAQCPWAVVSPGTLPPDRSAAVMAYDAARGRVVLFGGTKNGVYLSDTWEWDGASWSLKSPLTSPPGRWGGAMAYDPIRGKTILFGGTGNGLSLAITWQWDGTNWAQAATTGPSARYGHAMAFDASVGKIVLFGGNGNPLKDDTWTWNGASWSQVITSGPSGRYRHAMAYDAAHGRTILFGGMNNQFSFASGALAETWEFDGVAGQWTFKGVEGVGPGGRAMQSMVYDSVRQKIVMFGGIEYTNAVNGGPSNSRVLGDAWEWNGAWTRRDDAPFWPRFEHVAAFDAQHGAMVVFGASTTPGLMCSFDGAQQGQVRITQDPVGQVAYPGQPVTFTLAAQGATSFQWYKGGSPISGATASAYSIANVSSGDAGDYYAVVGTPCGGFPSESGRLQVVITNCYANCDQSTGVPVLTANDFMCFFNNYAAAMPYANCDGSTHNPLLTANDFQCFLNEYATGCR